MSAAAPRVPAPHVELRVFLERAFPGFEAAWGDDRSFAARLAWQRTLHGSGWAAPGWPVEHGGRALSVAERVRCDAELAAVGAPLPAGVIGIQNIAPTIMAFGTEEQRAHLAPMLAGDEVWCQGFSEPEAGSDLASLRTTARLAGERFVVHGQKVWTSQGADATHCELLVRTDPEAPRHRGLSVLLIPLDLPGIERRSIREMDGGAEFAELFFDDVEVPGDALCGALHEGWRVSMTTLAHERAGVVSLAARTERDVVARVEALLAGAAGDAVRRDELVRRWTDAKVLGLLGRRSLAGLDRGLEPGPEHSVIKLAWSQVGIRAARSEIDAAGPEGMLATSAAAAAFVSSPAKGIAAGTTEIMKNVLAERVLGLPR